MVDSFEENTFWIKITKDLSANIETSLEIGKKKSDNRQYRATAAARPKCRQWGIQIRGELIHRDGVSGPREAAIIYKDQHS